MITAKIVLAMMLALQPTAPWRDTYEASAATIADVSNAEALFQGEDGPLRTAALFVSLGWFEAHFQRDAVGDHARDKDGKRVGQGNSFCMFQINRSNLKTLGVTREELLADFGVCARTARRMLWSSLRICGARPLAERLAWYARGEDGCPTAEDPVSKSRHRVGKAQELLGRAW